MIRNEAEYKETVQRLQEERTRLDAQRTALLSTGLAEDEVKRVIDPMLSFYLQLVEEVEAYEKLRRGDFGEFTNLEGMGQLLIGLRIAKGISQRVLANRLDVHESQISRDERNEYHGITVDRVIRILDALEVEIRMSVESTGKEMVGQ